MKDVLATKLLARELHSPAAGHSSYPHAYRRRLYGDRSLITDLDIVNELDGHSGCVNALSWSKSGSLLASGSDDQHLNIHTYQGGSGSGNGSGRDFQLTTTVATGHTQNIFSVKFMPHHNDRTVITAAGDGEVRIFDLEYAGAAREASAASSMASQSRRRGRNAVYNGVRYLTDGDTDSRVYRSHGDRVKRIVTESSPHLFLTCSEDGEVRQWDLRLPSSSYPSPRGGRYGGGGGSSVPPPLISYKRYNLDLNTISCSASQPHYIALGGAHLHAFLHDRRMTGRDRLREAGKPLSMSASRSSEDEELMSQATQCVRKFAPEGQQRMKRTENGHITAVKISDARPDEMIVSWSGDHIYSFDLVRSPDTSEDANTGGSLRKGLGSKTKRTQERKRKRKVGRSSTSLGAAARPPSRPRTESADDDSEGATALRVRYQNGQSEDIPISIPRITEQEREAQHIAKSTVLIRSRLFGPPDGGRDPTDRFTAALGEAAASISDIDEIMRSWSYPLDPSPETVVVQQTLRRNRESARRFVQAAGTLARALGGKLQTASSNPSPLLAHFTSVESRTNDLQPTQKEHFGYDFLKAILLWLESGIGRLIEGFTRPADVSASSKAAARLPIPESEAGTEAIDDILIPYLLRLASDKPVINVESNRFETTEHRQLFPSERAAVLAFAAAVRIPFADLSSAVVLADGGERVQAQDRETAFRFWGMKVARGVLLNAAEGVNFAFVDGAFGGSGRASREMRTEELQLDGIGGGEAEEEAVESLEVLNEDGDATDGAHAEALAAAMRAARVLERQDEYEDTEMGEDGVATDGAPAEAFAAAMRASSVLERQDNHEAMEMGEEVEEGLFSRQATVEQATDDDDDDGDEEEDMDDDDDDDNDHDPLNYDNESDSSEPDEIDGVPNSARHFAQYIGSSFERRRHKERVEHHAPCSPYTRIYKGHCNVRTVKDVNYFGPDDSYVVSGSDDGNFFMWDRKSQELVGVWEGDGEVVNVVQGHPYETMLAVSGIDSTIKIFSPDARARAAARMGDGVTARDASEFSSIAWPPRRGGRRVPRRTERRPGATPVPEDVEAGATSSSEPAVPSSSAGDADERTTEAEEEDEDYIAPNGLASRKRMHDAYRITNQNDVERAGGGGGQQYVTVPHAQLLQLLFGQMGGGDVGWNWS